MKILIVDDDEIARISLTSILSSSGAELVQAEDGQDAWERMQAGLRPDVCCSDIVMPRLDGLGLMQRAREHLVLKDLPFVLISSAADRRTVEAAVAGGAAGYILKPFLAVQTRCTVDRVVRERRTARAEHFLVTRRRLAVPLEQLEQMLGLLRIEAHAFLQSLGSDDVDAVGMGVTLQRLHSSALVLGLWKAADYLKCAMAPGVPQQVAQVGVDQPQLAARTILASTPACTRRSSFVL